MELSDNEYAELKTKVAKLQRWEDLLHQIKSSYSSGKNATQAYFTLMKEWGLGPQAGQAMRIIQREENERGRSTEQQQ